ncbi:outer membrane protein assembly factor BamB [Allocatelliglobosispora scoriae]|uniref:Outer membrane protein assembly factor BamB n=1 Tax=Allocatelliglobosispora scoriae TaxID=643052 RepID=A0A841BJB2_9ACTN|nr:PQQ-binding-like beta-propeller repeat protein [Allocatelliglobosispora scoriae]MBB5867259.1 outer membrane protein assembly factor BamB [Allocatelliglobosispora scoriae]
MDSRRWWLRVGSLLVLASAMATGCTARGAEPPSPDGPMAAGKNAAVKALLDLPSGAPSTTWTPWPSAMRDARHSGMSASSGPTKGVVRWQRTLEAAVSSGPVIGADGTIYVASNGGVLHAVDATTGTDRWTYDSGRSGGGDLSVSPLVLPDHTIIWGTPKGELAALSAAGELLWTQELPGRPTSPVTVDGRRIYVGDTSGGISAVDVPSAGSRRLAWTLDVGSSSFASVVTDGTGRLYTTSGSSLVAVDDRGATGAVAWRADPGDGDSEVSAGLGTDGTVLLGTNGSFEWAYGRDGRLRWKAPRAITYSSPVVTGGGLAYVADHEGIVHVLDLRDGSAAATYRVTPGTQIWSSTVVDRDHRVYFGGQDGHAYGLDAIGKVLFNVDLGAPVDGYLALTADAALIVGARNGKLTSIQ